MKLIKEILKKLSEKTIHEQLDGELSKVKNNADNALFVFTEVLTQLKTNNEKIDVQTSIISQEKQKLQTKEEEFEQARQSNLRVIEKIENLLS